MQSRFSRSRWRQDEGDVPAPGQEDNRPELESEAESLLVPSHLAAVKPVFRMIRLGGKRLLRPGCHFFYRQPAFGFSQISIPSSSSVPPASSSAAATESDPPEVGWTDQPCLRLPLLLRRRAKVRRASRLAVSLPAHPALTALGIPVGTGSSTTGEGKPSGLTGDYGAYDAVCRVVAAEIGNSNYRSIKAQAVATYTLLYKRNQNRNYPPV